MLGPEFAIERMPAPVCFSFGVTSSSNCLLIIIKKGERRGEKLHEIKREEGEWR